MKPSPTIAGAREFLFKADALGLDEGDYAERPTFFHTSQLIANIALAAIVLFLPFGPPRFVLAAILIGYAAVQVIMREVLKPEYSDGLQLWVATLVALVCSTIVPVLVPAVAVVIAGLMVSMAQQLGRAAYILLALSVVWLAGIYFVDPTPNGYIPVLTLMAVCPAYIQYSLWAAGQFDVRRDREQLLMESGRALAWEYDPKQDRILSVTGPTEALLGYSQTQLTDLVNASLASTVGQRPAPTSEWTYRMAHADGSDRWFRISALSRARSDGTPLMYGVGIDITDVELGRQAEVHRANTDPLTGLANRDGFAKFLDEAVGKIGRAVLVIDLDRLKEVNDSLGHVVGDHLITAVAQRLSRLGGDDVCVARIGGDEFALAVVTDDEATAESLAESLARRINDCLHESYSLGGLEIHATASVGIASGSNLDWDTLLRHADGAMYNSKRSAEPYCWYDAVEDSGSVARLHLRYELERNLESQVVLYYQPIMCAVDRSVVSLEALARWDHPVRGVLEPGEFLPLIESSNLANRFDRHIMTMAVRTASELAALPHGPSLSANLHPESLRSPELIGHLRSLLAEYPLAAGRLVLEITEAGLADDPQRLLPSLVALKEFGVRLAIDDFGTGASSLIRLQSLPFDIVKIDRSFVGGVPEDSTDTTIVRSTIELARDLGMATVAEGVERLETADALMALGCDQLQGWLFAKAMPINEVVEQFTLSTTRSAGACN